MRQKKVKYLRGLARKRSIGCAEVAYITGIEPFYQSIKDKLGIVIGHVKVALGVPTKLEPTCTRYLYKKLKSVA